MKSRLMGLGGVGDGSAMWLWWRIVMWVPVPGRWRWAVRVKRHRWRWHRMTVSMVGRRMPSVMAGRVIIAIGGMWRIIAVSCVLANLVHLWRERKPTAFGEPIRRLAIRVCGRRLSLCFCPAFFWDVVNSEAEHTECQPGRHSRRGSFRTLIFRPWSAKVFDNSVASDSRQRSDCDGAQAGTHFACRETSLPNRR